MELKETSAQYYLQASISGISILCCLIVTIGFIAFKNLRKSALKLVLFLCISEMIYSISMIMRPPYVENNDLCAAQIFFGNLGHLSTLFWTCMISYSLRRSIQFGYEHVRGVMKKIIITSFVVPTTLAALILMRQYYFTGNDFCSVLQEGIEGSNAHEGEGSFFLQKLIMLLEFQIPIYVSFVFNLFSVVKVAQITKENNIPNVNTKLRRIYLYPFIVPTCQIFSFVYQVYVLCGGNPSNNTLITLNIIFSCLQGAINSIVYGFNQKLKLSFRNAYTNRISGTSTSLNDSLVHKVNNSSSSTYESPERKRSTAYKNFAKAYQTASEDEDEDNYQNTAYLQRTSQNNRVSVQSKNNGNVSYQNYNNNNNNNNAAENAETHYSSQRQNSSYHKSRYQQELSGSQSNNEMAELSDDLLDDVLSNHSTPSRQLQLTLADF